MKSVWRRNGKDDGWWIEGKDDGLREEGNLVRFSSFWIRWTV